MPTLIDRCIQSAIQTQQLLEKLKQQEEPKRKRGRPPKLQVTAQRGISQERLDRVVDYLRKHPGATQREITDALDFNSGTVSVAVRQLADQSLADIQGNGQRSKHIRLLA